MRGKEGEVHVVYGEGLRVINLTGLSAMSKRGQVAGVAAATVFGRHKSFDTVREQS